MLYRIVGLDPGGTTGLTAFTIEKDEGISGIESYELDLIGVGNYLQNRPYDVLAYEVANKFQASGHVSSEIIGIAKYFSAITYSSTTPIQQSAWKKLITRDVLKRASLDVKGTHAKDAAGVGLYWVVSHLKWFTQVLRTEEA